MGWLAQHRSAVFFTVLLLVSMLALVFGSMLVDSTIQERKVLGNILVTIAGTGLAAGIATAFFSFSDVQRQLARTAAMLLSEGGIVAGLGEKPLQRLREQVVLTHLGHGVASLDPSLLKHLQHVMDRNLALPHVHNMNIVETVEACRGREGFIVTHMHSTFRIDVHHLGAEVHVPYRFVSEFLLADLGGLSDDEVVIDFDVSFGDARYTKADILKTREIENNLPVLRLKFEVDVPVKAETSVSLRCSLLSIDDVLSTSQVVRFPTRGFSFTVKHSDDFEFDGFWMTSANPDFENLPGAHEITLIPGGIVGNTNGWVLPGEGFAATWKKKSTTDDEVDGGREVEIVAESVADD